MRRRRRSSRLPVLLVLLLLVVGGSVALARTNVFRGVVPAGPVAQAPPAVTPTPAPPSPDRTAERFFSAWERGDYDAMYDTLSAQARNVIPKERFVGRYRAINAGASIVSVSVTRQPARRPSAALQPSPAKGPKDSKTTSTPLPASQASMEAPYEVTMRSARFGDLAEENALPLVSEGDDWRVEWAPGLIFKGLTDQNLVRVLPDNPVRGSILDRKGRPLAAEGKVLSIGVIPKFVQDESQVVGVLSEHLGMKPEDVKARYARAQPDWWVPLRDLPQEKRPEAEAKLGQIAGIALRDKPMRVYPSGPIAAHLIGYVAKVNADDLKRLAAKGYEEDDFIGRQGIEAWGEETLAGEKGGKLVIATQAGATVRTIAERQAKAGGDVQLTIDVDVQRMAEKALGEKTGSVVILDARDNSILALVSHPAFDPNGFVLGFSVEEWKKLADDERRPFQNRASLSTYPTGSIFKVVTMAAGLEKGGYRPDSVFNSTGTWDGLGGGVVLRNWLPQGHGRINLVDGLGASDNIVFYELGKKLDTIDSTILPGFARQFGLGEAPGTVGLPEAEGTVPDPEWKRAKLRQGWYMGDTVNLAIGQGFLEATPLQVANLFSALAAGGSLRTPVLVRRAGVGTAAKEYGATEKRKLPVSPANLGAIREGMKRTAASAIGTANYAFKGFRIPTAAKTGSAENQNPDAHAWFAGYAPADAPEVVVTVMVEGGKAGGEVAAPLARQFLEAYFAGR
ncbi:MAG: penicillin-binding protein 2 [Chloroflexi bacterium]|nr:penicillin-binding protein 2 [Chloroflexota bacterium]